MYKKRDLGVGCLLSDSIDLLPLIQIVFSFHVIFFLLHDMYSTVATPNKKENDRKKIMDAMVQNKINDL